MDFTKLSGVSAVDCAAGATWEQPESTTSRADATSRLISSVLPLTRVGSSDAGSWDRLLVSHTLPMALRATRLPRWWPCRRPSFKYDAMYPDGTVAVDVDVDEVLQRVQRRRHRVVVCVVPGVRADDQWVGRLTLAAAQDIPSDVQRGARFRTSPRLIRRDEPLGACQRQPDPLRRGQRCEPCASRRKRQQVPRAASSCQTTGTPRFQPHQPLRPSGAASMTGALHRRRGERQVSRRG